MSEDTPSGGARVLVADDEESIRFVLREALEDEGHQVTAVADGDSAFEALASGESFDLAFLDLRMPGQSGIELLSRTRDIGVEIPVVIITAQNTMENAIEAMKQGALDYLVKPFSLAEVTALVAKAMRTRALQQEVSELRREVARGIAPGGERLVGQSQALLEIFKMVGRVASRNVPVLVTGESGTGKELVARALHSASPRAEGPFVAVNTAAIPRELLESELFGHEKGAFTGAIEARRGRFRDASGGTLFLDEIGDMSPDLQSKLLRVLQSSEVTSVGGSKTESVDVRIVAATHRDLDAEIGAGKFREDLLYRLRVVPIHLPPLRERRDDIRSLAEHFVDRYAAELSEMDSALSESAIEKLERADWPGNVRELENAIKRALVLSSERVLTPEDFAFIDESRGKDPAGLDLGQLVRQEAAIALEGPAPEELYRDMLERVERPLLEAVLAHTEGNQIRAAAILGINRNTLRKKITELGIALESLPRS
jgi:two-component system nitrogen regulation response regulator GlnG